MKCPMLEQFCLVHALYDSHIYEKTFLKIQIYANVFSEIQI